MATFTTCIRYKRTDGMYAVYIRVAHNKKSAYIKTAYIVGDKGIKTTYTAAGKEQIEVADKKVLKNCLYQIDAYVNRINNINAAGMDCNTLVEYLTAKSEDISFTDFADEYIISLKNDDRVNPSNSYKLSVNSLHKFMTKESILFRDITKNVINNWIESMRKNKRSKSLYPVCVRKIIKTAIDKYNDEDNDLIRIKNPFRGVVIPKQEETEKRSVPGETVKKLFTSEITFPIYDGVTVKEISRDVALIIFCLAGINAADLYDMKESSLKDWKLCYNRKKTREKSGSGSYIEITVPEMIRPLFQKYRGSAGKLFCFRKRYATSQAFVSTVNSGLDIICNEIGIKKATTYTFRHTWATIAQNDCGASTEQVAFALNHTSAHKITEGYIRKDYSPIDRLNEQVLKRVFG